MRRAGTPIAVRCYVEPDRYVETLQEAAQSVGGETRLAYLLMVPEPKLARWMAGEEPVPLDAFLNALDVIAEGLFADAARTKPVRVAVLPETATPPQKKTPRRPVSSVATRLGYGPSSK